MMAKLVKTLQLHFPMIQFLITAVRVQWPLSLTKWPPCLFSQVLERSLDSNEEIKSLRRLKEGNQLESNLVHGFC